jgi:hypothetical protein
MWVRDNKVWYEAELIEKIKDYCIAQRNEFCESHCHRTTVCEKRNCYPIRDLTNIYNLIQENEK